MPLLITLGLFGTALACASAVFWGRLAGIGFSIFWSVGLLYLAVPPAFSFTGADPLDLEVLGSLGVVGILAALQAPGARRVTPKSSQPSPYDVEFHLTPNGWVRGTEWFVGIIQAEITPPPNRILTIVKRVTTSAATGRDEISWRNTWRNTAIPEAEVAAVRSRFQAPVDLAAPSFEPAEAKLGRNWSQYFLARFFGVDDEPYSGE